jgi:anti-sigma-K factor RskA
MAHEKFDEAVALYAVEALEPAEWQAFEAHLREGCTECRNALREYQAAARLLPYALPPAEVPLELRSHLMTTFRRDFSTPSEKDTDKNPSMSRPPVRRPFGGRWAIVSHPVFVLAALMLIVVTGYALTLRSQVQIESAQRRQLEAALQAERPAAASPSGPEGSENTLAAKLAEAQNTVGTQELELSQLRARLAQREREVSALNTLTSREAELAQLRVRAEKEKEVEALNKALARRDEILGFLRSPAAKVVSLAGSEEAKSAGALLIFDPGSKKGFFYAFNMPLLPGGKTYQLWAMGTVPVSVGIFSTDIGNKSRIMIRHLPDLSRIQKYAVSVEPEGGRSQPTGPVYLSGQL